MKKFLLVLLALLMCLSLVACDTSGTPADNTPINTFTSLKNDQVLTVGENNRFMNYENVVETICSLSYTESVTYTLNRTSYNDYSDNSIYYNGYYYYWTTSKNTTSIQLGTATLKTTYNYSYLTYSENENIVVKSTVIRSTTYDFEGGWIEKPVTVTYNLRGYFDTIDDIVTKVPSLAKLIDTSDTYKYYYDTSTPDTINTSTNSYNTYYYIENK